MSKQEKKTAKRNRIAASESRKLNRFARYVVGEEDVDFTDGLLSGEIASELRTDVEVVLLDTVGIRQQLVSQGKQHSAAGEVLVFLSSNAKSVVADENGDSFRELIRNALKHCVRSETSPFIVERFGEAIIAIVFGFAPSGDLPSASESRILGKYSSEINVWRWLIEERLKAENVEGAELLGQLEELTFPSLEKVGKEAVIDLAASLLSSIPTASIHRVIERAELSDAKRQRIHDATRSVTVPEIIARLRDTYAMSDRKIAKEIGSRHSHIARLANGDIKNPNDRTRSRLENLLEKKSTSDNQGGLF